MPQNFFLDSFPEDYQVLLSDLWQECTEDELPSIFTTIARSAEVFQEQMKDQLHYWEQEDFDKAEEYKLAYWDGDRFPPLITNPNDWLLDGFHRFYAMTQLRIRYIDCIELPPPR